MVACRVCAGRKVFEVVQDSPACRYGGQQGRAGQGRAGQGRAGQGRAGRGRLTSASHGSHAVLHEFDGQPLHETYAENSPSSTMNTAATIEYIDKHSVTDLSCLYIRITQDKT